MPNIGPMEIAVVVGLALLVFGPKRLPELGRSLGRGMREFKQSISGLNDDDEVTREKSTKPPELKATANGDGNGDSAALASEPKVESASVVKDS